MRELKVESLNVEDYIIKVADGQPDYIDGSHPVHSFKYIRHCIAKKERISLELVSRSSVKIETQMLDDDPTAYTELFDPRVKYHHKVRLYLILLNNCGLLTQLGNDSTKSPIHRENELLFSLGYEQAVQSTDNRCGESQRRTQH